MHRKIGFTLVAGLVVAIVGTATVTHAAGGGGAAGGGAAGMAEPPVRLAGPGRWAPVAHLILQRCPARLRLERGTPR